MKYLFEEKFLVLRKDILFLTILVDAWVWKFCTVLDVLTVLHHICSEIMIKHVLLCELNKEKKMTYVVLTPMKKMLQIELIIWRYMVIYIYCFNYCYWIIRAVSNKSESRLKQTRTYTIYTQHSKINKQVIIITALNMYTVVTPSSCDKRKHSADYLYYARNFSNTRCFSTVYNLQHNSRHSRTPRILRGHLLRWGITSWCSRFQSRTRRKTTVYWLYRLYSWGTYT